MDKLDQEALESNYKGMDDLDKEALGIEEWDKGKTDKTHCRYCGNPWDWKYSNHSTCGLV